jgi:hypothetical protein
MDKYYKKYRKYKRKYIDITGGNIDNIFMKFNRNEIEYTYNKKDIDAIANKFFDTAIENNDYICFLNGIINRNIEKLENSIINKIGKKQFMENKNIINNVIKNTFTKYKIKYDNTIGIKNENKINDFIIKIIEDTDYVYLKNKTVAEIINDNFNVGGIKGEIDGLICNKKDDKLIPIAILEIKNSYTAILEDIPKFEGLINYLSDNNKTIQKYDFSNIKNIYKIYVISNLSIGEKIKVVNSRNIVNLINSQIMRQLYKKKIDIFCKIDELDNYITNDIFEPSITIEELANNISNNMKTMNKGKNNKINQIDRTIMGNKNVKLDYAYLDEKIRVKITPRENA